MATKKNEEIKGWWNITGKAKIFANDVNYKKNGKKMSFKKFSTSLSVKNDDDEWENFYINVGFKKDEAPDEDITDINIISGFLTFDSGDKKYLKLVVTDYEII